jgi:MFS family permease
LIAIYVLWLGVLIVLLFLKLAIFPHADIGVIAGAVLFIKEDLLITDVQEEILVGSLNIVSLVGAASAGRIADAVGRRWTMSIAALFFLVGAAVMGAAPNFGLLMVGRLLEGIGVGFALMIAPVYTAELAPASSRGSLVSLPEVFINLGILLGYIVSYSLAGLPAKVGWRVMLTIGILPATCLAIGVLFMPESPRWLVMQNRIDEAKIVLQKTSNDKEEAHARLLEIMDAAGIIKSDVIDGHSSTRVVCTCHNLLFLNVFAVFVATSLYIHLFNSLLLFSILTVLTLYT